ncbi:GIY-YIG nuclease family protein [Proteiniborus sp. MB09-C3]|uniref:GIY-YIG nuclease family protein n=1 Tax=Proteiniborus sp. MB09-C3 TaxID=3050072 RepID=UPI002556D774|nr:GIY-YIG nuclease family protein [Proteiniborus sp. MB09-C3]WIV11459.1 GIY-YIG nuclease family protein [Proteiniborus sp. MB09-C3]
MDLKEKVKNLPSSPGVYIMKNSFGDIIYVGKSKNLKNRVSSYFQNSKNHPQKIERLVKTLKDFDYIITDTEFEAFMLECKLIKKLKPLYNRLMKSPSSYIYIEIISDNNSMSIKAVNIPNEKHSATYFGPYTSRSTVERSIQGIKEFCKIACNNPSKKSTSCLNYSLDLCLGMCMGGEAIEKYNKIINKIIDLFSGIDGKILEEMEQKMLHASNDYDFETAAKYRDYISAIKTLVSKERVIEFTEDNKNIAIVEYLNDSSIKLFLVKGNKILFKEKYNMNSLDTKRLYTSIKSNILNYFKDNDLSITIQVNKEDVDEAQIIYSYLKSNNCNYAIIQDVELTPDCIDDLISSLLHLKK